MKTYAVAGVALATLAVALPGFSEASRADTTILLRPSNGSLRAEIGPGSDTYGASRTAVNYGMMGWTPSGDGQWTHDAATGWSFLASGNPRACTNVHLPNGSRIEAVFLDAEVTMGQVSWQLRAINILANTSTAPIDIFTTGPGLYRGLADLPQAITIDNAVTAYVLCTIHSVAGPDLRNGGFGFRYRLQVSPPPVMATFPNDVPTTHPLFRFVEAMAASGLTGGCAPGAFCPDSPLTRGQMAVFLSVALGLHFPN